VVALADGGPGTHTPSLQAVAVRTAGRVEVHTTVDERPWATRGAPPPLEEEARHPDPEERRAFYVACTRAKDRLVIPHVPQAEPTGFNRFLAEAGDGALVDAEVRTVAPLAEGEVPEPPPPLRPDWEAGAAHPIRAERAAWAADLRALLGAAAPPPRPAAARAAADGPALAVGRAVHAVLELVDLAAPGDLAAAARAAAAAEGHPDRAGEVRALVERALALGVARRAAAARRCWRELPLFIEEADAQGPRVVEGRPDLLFEEASGKLVLADWKTDAALTPEAERAYTVQLRRYAGALARAGRPVAEAWLLLLRTGTQVPVGV
jgi:ATP-dependent exoDNAse (exonuclease V) beta subunit